MMDTKEYLLSKFYTKSNNSNRDLICYLIANLALIPPGLIALINLIRFIQDEPIYQYIEQLLGLTFYHRLVYVLVVIPLVLLVPTANALGAILNRGPPRGPASPTEPSRSLITLRAVYLLLLTVLVIIALIFIVPNVKTTNLSSRIEMVLRNHMSRRYDSQFSYQFLDTLQEQFECCDELWYRIHLNDKLPISCFEPNGLFDVVYNQTCAQVVGSLVANRCTWIAASLFLILVALLCLLAIDTIELLTISSRQYNVESREADLRASRDGLRQSPTITPTGKGNQLDDDECEQEDQNLVSSAEIEERLRLRERDSEKQPRRETLDSSSLHNSSAPASNNSSGRSSPILTRATYNVIEQRSQSPVLLEERRTLGPIKGVLKKTSSFQRIDVDSDSSFQSDQDDDKFGGSSLRASQSTRRSLLSVRFAE